MPAARRGHRASSSDKTVARPARSSSLLRRRLQRRGERADDQAAARRRSCISFTVAPARPEYLDAREDLRARWRKSLRRGRHRREDRVDCYALMCPEDARDADGPGRTRRPQEDAKEIEGTKFQIKGSSTKGDTATLKVFRQKGDESDTGRSPSSVRTASGRCSRRNEPVRARVKLLLGSRAARLRGPRALGAGGLGASRARSISSRRRSVPGTRARPTRSARIDPIRVADASPSAETKPAATPATPAASAVGKACESDNDCPDETICERNACQAIHTSTNILYLYYREGTFHEIAGLYRVKRGPAELHVPRAVSTGTPGARRAAPTSSPRSSGASRTTRAATSSRSWRRSP